MVSMKTISAALKLIDVKKENLRKAFEELDSHSSSLSSFTLTWSDLDSHFTSIQSSLTQQFNHLQSLEKIPQSQTLTLTVSAPAPATAPSQAPPTAPSQAHPTAPIPAPPPALKSVSDSVPPRPELRLFCERMDGKGLRGYIIDRKNERDTLRLEISGALRYAPDPAAMVLDAMEGFYGLNSNSKKGDKDPALVGIRRTCAILLEALIGVVQKEEIKSDVKKRARNLAVEWQGKVSKNGENTLEVLGFLHLLGSYGLVDEFNVEEIVDLLVLVARYREATLLCRSLGIVGKIPDLVQKLINTGKQLLALKFIFEFELADKFPPVPLLKAHVKESKKVAQRVRKKGNHSLQSLNEAMAKEVSALRSVIKYVENHNLESEYPRGILERRIEQLEKQKADMRQKADRKRSAPAKPKQPKLVQQSGSKRPRTDALPAPVNVPQSAAGVNSTFSPFQPSHLQMAGLLPDDPYFSSSAGPYGLAGPNPAVAPYTGTSAGPYGLAGAPMGFPGGPSPARPHLYPSESHMPSGYYDRPPAYGGYGLPPQYHPPYYHQ